MKKLHFLYLLLSLLTFSACAQQGNKAADQSEKKEKNTYEVIKSDEEWRAQLSEQQYYVTRQEGTERAFTGKYYKHKEEGTYTCICCGHPLFESSTKYSSGTGWPSFWAPVDSSHINYVEDLAYGWNRVEVECMRCGAHLGHVFEDGPKPTGLRYCINSASLDFKKK